MKYLVTEKIEYIKIFNRLLIKKNINNYTF